MIAAAFGTLLVAFASALVPVIPIEPYLVGLVATTDNSPVVLGVAAGIGQTCGKVLLFLGARGVFESEWVRSRLNRRLGKAEENPDKPRRAWVEKLLHLLNQPTLTLPIVLLSASVGIPPLLLVAVLVARTSMSVTTFAAVCVVGRTARFIVVALAPHLILS